MSETSTSMVFSVRIRLDDLASITHALISSGTGPKSLSHAASLGLSLLATHLTNSRIAPKYSPAEGAEFLEHSGLYIGNPKRNLRKLANQLQNFTPETMLSPEEIQQAKLHLSTLLEEPKECLPPSEEEILEVLTTQKPKGVVE